MFSKYDRIRKKRKEKSNNRRPAVNDGDGTSKSINQFSIGFLLFIFLISMEMMEEEEEKNSQPPRG